MSDSFICTDEAAVLVHKTTMQPFQSLLPIIFVILQSQSSYQWSRDPLQTQENL